MRDNNAMHAKPDLRAFLKMDDRWFGLGDRCRYTYFDAFRCLTPTVFLILLLGTAVNLGRLRQ